MVVRWFEFAVHLGGILAEESSRKPGLWVSKGAAQKLDVPVSEMGPLLVLKLNAFDDRQQPKDAYDVLLGVTRYVEGPEAAIAAFHAEANASNRVR